MIKIRHYSFSETLPSFHNDRTAFIVGIIANYLITPCISGKKHIISNTLLIKTIIFYLRNWSYSMKLLMFSVTYYSITKTRNVIAINIFYLKF